MLSLCCDEEDFANLLEGGLGGGAGLLGAGSGALDAISPGGLGIGNILATGAMAAMLMTMFGGHRPRLRLNNPKVHNFTPAAVPPPLGYGGTGRKAMLVGINYFGTRSALKGCVLDVQRIARRIHGSYELLVLTDDQMNPAMQPTKRNILAGLAWLTQNLAPQGKKTLFLHFSGHGSQEEDRDGDEVDGLDETICPVDYERAGMISDDVLKAQFLLRVPVGNRVLAVMDCCHSGTVLDLPYYAVANRSEADCVLMGDQMSDKNRIACDALMISGCEDAQTSADVNQVGKQFVELADPRAGGALTSALLSAFPGNTRHNLRSLLYALRRQLRSKGFDQIPQISASYPYDMGATAFDLFPEDFEAQAQAARAAHAAYRPAQHPQPQPPPHLAQSPQARAAFAYPSPQYAQYPPQQQSRSPQYPQHQLCARFRRLLRWNGFEEMLQISASYPQWRRPASSRAVEDFEAQAQAARAAHAAYRPAQHPQPPRTSSVVRIFVSVASSTRRSNSPRAVVVLCSIELRTSHPTDKAGDLGTSFRRAVVRSPPTSPPMGPSRKDTMPLGGLDSTERSLSGTGRSDFRFHAMKNKDDARRAAAAAELQSSMKAGDLGTSFLRAVVRSPPTSPPMGPSRKDTMPLGGLDSTERSLSGTDRSDFLSSRRQFHVMKSKDDARRAAAAAELQSSMKAGDLGTSFRRAVVRSPPTSPPMGPSRKDTMPLGGLDSTERSLSGTDRSDFLSSRRQFHAMKSKDDARRAAAAAELQSSMKAGDLGTSFRRAVVRSPPTSPPMGPSRKDTMPLGGLDSTERSLSGTGRSDFLSSRRQFHVMKSKDDARRAAAAAELQSSMKAGDLGTSFRRAVVRSPPTSPPMGPSRKDTMPLGGLDSTERSLSGTDRSDFLSSRRQFHAMKSKDDARRAAAAAELQSSMKAGDLGTSFRRAVVRSPPTSPPMGPSRKDTMPLGGLDSTERSLSGTGRSDFLSSRRQSTTNNALLSPPLPRRFHAMKNKDDARRAAAAAELQSSMKAGDLGTSFLRAVVRSPPTSPPMGPSRKDTMPLGGLDSTERSLSGTGRSDFRSSRRQSTTNNALLSPPLPRRFHAMKNKDDARRAAAAAELQSSMKAGDLGTSFLRAVVRSPPTSPPMGPSRKDTMPLGGLDSTERSLSGTDRSDFRFHVMKSKDDARRAAAAAELQSSMKAGDLGTSFRRAVVRSPPTSPPMGPSRKDTMPLGGLDSTERSLSGTDRSDFLSSRRQFHAMKSKDDARRAAAAAELQSSMKAGDLGTSFRRAVVRSPPTSPPMGPSRKDTMPLGGLDSTERSLSGTDRSDFLSSRRQSTTNNALLVLRISSLQRTT
ncbi:Metacaspase-1 [Diplonema papillatum]|nr:Metacaspase-1 [Diplonema papillatum]